MGEPNPRFRSLGREPNHAPILAGILTIHRPPACTLCGWLEVKTELLVWLLLGEVGAPATSGVLPSGTFTMPKGGACWVGLRKQDPPLQLMPLNRIRIGVSSRCTHAPEPYHGAQPSHHKQTEHPPPKYWKHRRVICTACTACTACALFGPSG